MTRQDATDFLSSLESLIELKIEDALDAMRENPGIRLGQDPIYRIREEILSKLTADDEW